MLVFVCRPTRMTEANVSFTPALNLPHELAWCARRVLGSGATVGSTCGLITVTSDIRLSARRVADGRQARQFLQRPDYSFPAAGFLVTWQFFVIEAGTVISMPQRAASSPSFTVVQPTRNRSSLRFTPELALKAWCAGGARRPLEWVECASPLVTLALSICSLPLMVPTPAVGGRLAISGGNCAVEVFPRHRQGSPWRRSFWLLIFQSGIIRRLSPWLSAQEIGKRQNASALALVDR